MPDVEELDYIEYLQYLRDAFILKCQQTEEGQQYLADAWRLEQTKPDKEKLKRFSKKGENKNEKF